MRILGIITEYNPYHLGHRLHLQEAKKLIKPDLTICVMSSSFVQRGPSLEVITMFFRP